MNDNGSKLYYIYVLSELEAKKKKLEKEINNSLFPSQQKKEELEKVEKLLREKMEYFWHLIE